MGQLYDAVVDYLIEDGWQFNVAQEEVAVQFGFRGSSTIWQCLCLVDEENQLVRMYSIAPVVVPQELRPAVAEYITRANYGLPLGNFELDYNDGEVRFKTSIDVEGGQFTSTMIANLFNSNLLMMDRYLPGLFRVVYAGVSPADAVSEIESSPLPKPASQPRFRRLTDEDLSDLFEGSETFGPLSADSDNPGEDCSDLGESEEQGNKED